MESRFVYFCSRFYRYRTGMDAYCAMKRKFFSFEKGENIVLCNIYATHIVFWEDCNEKMHHRLVDLECKPLR